jgi:ABC-type multidrug transport system ATPase subunit
VASQNQFSVELESAGKKFFRNWIFKNISFRFETPQKISVLGKNGSGKSTLLQVIAGYESLSDGVINYTRNGKQISREAVYRSISIAAPYLELIEEYTLSEMVKFHFRFKTPSGTLSVEDIIQLTQLEQSKNKIIKYYSSGMKQRVRLALAILSDVDLVLLDEPLSNLDRDGEMWYKSLAEKFLMEKSAIVCSNQNELEYFFCDRNINIADYKKTL